MQYRKNLVNIPIISIEYRPHHAQKEIHNSKARFRIAVCGRRFGKTTMALAELIFNATIRKPNSLNWYIAPTYRQAKQTAWKMLQSMIPRELVVRKHEGELSITLFNESRIELKGTDIPDSLRGVGLDFVVMDEYADMKPHVWEEIIRPTLADTQGEAMFIGTPDGYNHFYDMYLRGIKGSEVYDPDYQSWRKSSNKNPYFPQEEWEKAKKDSTEDAFAQEYEADFRHFTGRVYKGFNREIHVIPPFDIPQHWNIGRYMDRGWRVPSGVGYVAIDEHDNWYIFDEIYATNLTNPELAEFINSRQTNKYFWHSYADSAQASDLMDLENLGAYFSPVKKEPGERAGEWIRMGIQKVAERLKLGENGKPKLFVFSNCQNHIFEFENYSWDDKKDENFGLTERPLKKSDHLMDGLRYFACMYKAGFGVNTNISSGKKKDWSFRA